MANDFFLDELKKGSDHWNQWLDDWISAKIREAGFEEGADGTWPDEAFVHEILIRESIRITNASLIGAQLAEVDLWGITLSNTDFTKANLSGANLQRSNLDEADLWKANLTGARLSSAIMTDVDLLEADLVDAALESADLTDANLQDCDLSGANLTNAAGIEFNHNTIRGTTFTAHPERLSHIPIYRRLDTWLKHRFVLAPMDDKWSLLRRDYTGVKMVLMWIALILFLAPRVLTGIWLYVLSDAVEGTERILATDPKVFADAGSHWELLISYSSEIAIWRVMLGLTDWELLSIGWALLSVLLFVYTLGRFWLTLQVNPLRDAEARSGRTPVKEDYTALYKFHRLALAPIGLVAGLLTLWNIGHFVSWMITTKVPVF